MSPAQSRPRMNRSEFTVGWICALTVEHTFACELLDEEYTSPSKRDKKDQNIYTCGRIGTHNVVVACLPSGKLGNISAAAVAIHMGYSFPNISIMLLVGIGGGAPSHDYPIFLGDVVVSNPTARTGGVIRYDFGRLIPKSEFQITGSLPAPPNSILSAVGSLHAHHSRHGHDIADEVARVVNGNDKLRKVYERPSRDADILFQSTFIHQDNEKTCLETCAIQIDQIVERFPRSSDSADPCVHYGLIASADQVMRDAEERDRLAAAERVACFDMEAAGLMGSFPCLVIRGISDYSDTHKNDLWQGYAAATAAVYAKELLRAIPADEKESFAEEKKQPAEDNELPAEKNELPGEEKESHAEENEFPVEKKYFALSGSILITLATLLVILIAFAMFLGGAGTRGSDRELLDRSLPIFAVLGKTGVGKSSFIGILGGRHVKTNKPPSVSDRLDSHTQQVDFYRFEMRDGGPAYLIDTPGVDDSDSSRNDTEIMNMIYNELKILSNRDKLLMGLVFLYDITQTRIGGAVVNSLDMTIEMIEELLGRNGIAKISLVTTRWTPNPTSASIPLSCGSKIERYDDTKNRAAVIIEDLYLREKPSPDSGLNCRKFPKAVEDITKPAGMYAWWAWAGEYAWWLLGLVLVVLIGLLLLCFLEN